MLWERQRALSEVHVCEAKLYGARLVDALVQGVALQRTFVIESGAYGALEREGVFLGHQARCMDQQVFRLAWHSEGYSRQVYEYGRLLHGPVPATGVWQRWMRRSMTVYISAARKLLCTALGCFVSSEALFCLTTCLLSNCQLIAECLWMFANGPSLPL